MKIDTENTWNKINLPTRSHPLSESALFMSRSNFESERLAEGDSIQLCLNASA